MNLLFFDPYYTGHHSEYINNVLTYFEQNAYTNGQIYVAMHQNIEDILQLKNRLIPNVKYVFLPERKNGYFSQLQEVKSIVRQYDIQHVVLLFLNTLFVGLAFRRFNFTVSGIVMNPFYPAYTRYSPFARFYKEILYWAVSRRKNIEKLFILNDQENVDWLNRHFCSNKFRYISDPVPFFKPERLPADIYEIKRSRRIALHFGVLSERKGTLLILDAIDILPEDTIDKVSFLFAGKPCDNDFGEKIERKITALQQKRRNISIIYKPDFATSGMMESYFYLSDFVLIPYTMRNMSSGVLGHAAKYGKPVITGKGLLESIVNKYRLGIAVEPTIENIKNAIIRFADQNEDRVISDYAKEHSVSSFVETMMN